MASLQICIVKKKFALKMNSVFLHENNAYLGSQLSLLEFFLISSLIGKSPKIEKKYNFANQ